MRGTILIIEDDPLLLDNMGQLLDMQGYNVVTALDGQAGITLAQQIHPDLVLCDLMMKPVGGFAVLAALCVLNEVRPIPVVMLSGRVDAAMQAQVLERGAFAYFSKPFDVPVLLDTIDEILRVG